MAYLAIPIIGLWRFWLGRGASGWPSAWLTSTGKPFPGATYIQYALIIGGMFLVSHPWNIALTNAVFILLLARITGHTPILYPPGAMPPSERLSGLEAWLWGVSGNNWYVFGGLRYVFPAALWDISLLLQHVNAQIAAASLIMLLFYNITSRFGKTWIAELGWAAYGVALAFAVNI